MENPLFLMIVGTFLNQMTQQSEAWGRLEHRNRNSYAGLGAVQNV